MMADVCWSKACARSECLRLEREYHILQFHNPKLSNIGRKFYVQHVFEYFRGNFVKLPFLFKKLGLGPDRTRDSVNHKPVRFECLTMAPKALGKPKCGGPRGSLKAHVDPVPFRFRLHVESIFISGQFRSSPSRFRFVSLPSRFSSISSSASVPFVIVPFPFRFRSVSVPALLVPFPFPVSFPSLVRRGAGATYSSLARPFQEWMEKLPTVEKERHHTGKESHGADFAC